MPSDNNKDFELVSVEEKNINNSHHSNEVQLGAKKHLTIDVAEEDGGDSLTTYKEDDLNEVLRVEDLYPWFNVVLIAIAVGTTEFIPLFFLGVGINYKYKLLDQLIDSSGLGIMTLANTAFSCVCIVTAALTTRLVPCSAGSGVPPLIGYLYNGRKTDRALFTSQMVLVKMIGVELAIVGGLAVGREGPAIHIGAAIGDLTNRLINKVIREYTGNKVPFSGAVKSNVVMMGATCGFASAFRSPIGGMLYCVEEIATHWDIKSHMSVGAQTFVAASIAAVITQVILNVSSQSANVSFSSIIIFSEDEANAGHTTAAYHYHDMPGFLLAAILCGLLAGLTTRASNWLRLWRKKAVVPSSTVMQILFLVRDAILVASFTTLSFSLLPLIYTNCKSEPHAVHDDEPHRLLSGGGGDRTFVQYTCPEGQYSQLASLSLAGEEGVIRHLLSRDGEDFKLPALLIFLVMYLPISMSNRLIPIPMGSFVPNLLIGALVGRIVGEGMQAIYPDSVMLSPPGVFALLGAGSMLGAWTRTMMAVVVTLLEVTGDVGMVSPLICGVVIARSIATKIADHSYTHELFYELIDDPNSDGPLLLHPNDWKPQKKVVDDAVLTEASAKEGNTMGQRTSVRLATPTGVPYRQGVSMGMAITATEAAESGRSSLRQRRSLEGMGALREPAVATANANVYGFHGGSPTKPAVLRTMSTRSVGELPSLVEDEDDGDDDAKASKKPARRKSAKT